LAEWQNGEGRENSISRTLTNADLAEPLAREAAGNSGILARAFRRAARSAQSKNSGGTNREPYADLTVETLGAESASLVSIAPGFLFKRNAT
jgi:hypothetical protein